jgi:hypothetical protein
MTTDTIKLTLCDGGTAITVAVERIKKLKRHACGSIVTLSTADNRDGASVYVKEKPEDICAVSHCRRR